MLLVDASRWLMRALECFEMRLGMFGDQKRERVELALAWSFPFTYLIHITEEYLSGVALSTSPSTIRGANLTPTQFLILNGIACLLMVAGILISRRLKFRTWLLVCLGTVAVVNGLFHVVVGLSIAGYNPGLASGFFIWIPLGAATLIYLRKRLRPGKFWGAVAVGALIHVIVFLFASSGRRLFEGYALAF